jgi:hypothetical protein
MGVTFSGVDQKLVCRFRSVADITFDATLVFRLQEHFSMQE